LKRYGCAFYDGTFSILASTLDSSGTAGSGQSKAGGGYGKGMEFTPSTTASLPLGEAISQRLAGVIDPELGLDIVSLGMVGAIGVSDGHVEITVALTTPSCPLRGQIERDVRQAILSLDDVRSVDITMGQLSPEAKARLMDTARSAAQQDAPNTSIPLGARVLGISSGKGGVGKSSITANLAVALAARGLTIGVIDADIWGFSLPRLLGVDGPVEAKDKKMVPKKLTVGSGELRILSMGFLADEEQAIMWRGLILNRALQQFVEDAHWDDIDYLLIDLPPGTGDVQMGLARLLPKTELLIVTTPPLAAQNVAARAADMARRGNIRVAGVIENMSDFTCEHGTSYALFGTGGGERLSKQLGVPFLGTIPIDPAVARGGDIGSPIALGTGPTSDRFAEIAERLVTDVAPLRELEGCTARLLATLDDALNNAEL
jgi:ATP-binding protein involved in chromosome partitioning